MNRGPAAPRPATWSLAGLVALAACGAHPASGPSLDGGADAPAKLLGEFIGPSPFLDTMGSDFAPAAGASGWASLALVDFDGDGDIDIFVGNDGGWPNLLYLNDGHGHFRDVAAQAGVTLGGEWTFAVGVGDFDGDGLLDLVLGTQIKPPSISPHGGQTSAVHYLKNLGLDANGDLHFDDRTAEVGLSPFSHASSFAVADFDGDGRLDLYIGRYDLRDIVFSHGSYLPDTPNVILRNEDQEGHPFFVDRTADAGVAGTEFAGLAPSTSNIIGVPPTWTTYATDIDGDGRMDILVGHEVPGGIDIFMNEGGWTFRRLEDEAWQRHGGWMGICAADTERDGQLAYFVSNVGADFPILHPGQHHLSDSPAPPEGSPFLRLLRWSNADGLRDTAADAVVQPGALPPRNAWNGQGIAAYEFGFGCAFPDIDNDGWPDLTWTGDLPITTDQGPRRVDFHGVSRLLMRQPDGSWADRTAEMDLFPWSPDQPLDFGYARAGRALAAADLDGDGFPDLCRTFYQTDGRRGDALQCLHNPGGTGHWVVVRLRARGSNRFAIGGRVELTSAGRTAVAEIVTTTSSFTAVEPQAHFGLGSAASANRIAVHWPSGQVSELFDVTADRVLVLDEP